MGQKIKNFSGFTLIELLVVITILGLFASAIIVVFTNTRARSRDTTRLSDVNRIQSALNLYWQSAGVYPETLESGDPLEHGGIVFMARVPFPPTPSNDGDCELLEAEDLKYEYITIGSGGSMTYEIHFCLGAPNSGLEAGDHVVTPHGIIPASE